MKSAQHKPPIRVFMDNQTVTTESVPGCRWVLQGLEKLMEWAWMSFKPAKSTSLVLKRRRVDNTFRFSTGGITIPTVTEKPVKCLGKVFDSTVRDTSSI